MVFKKTISKLKPKGLNDKTIGNNLVGAIASKLPGAPVPYVKPSSPLNAPSSSPGGTPSSTPPVNNNSIKFRDKTGRGDVEVNGVPYTREAYNASIAAQGGGSRSYGGGANAQQVNQILASQAQVRANQAFAGVPLQQAEPLQPDPKKPGIDALDVGGVIGGATAGAAAGTYIGGVAGSVVPGVGNVVGGLAGGAIGAIGGAVSSFYVTQTTDRRQAVRTGYAKFTTSASQIENLIKDVNSGAMSPMQADVYWDNEYSRVLQAQREIKIASSGFFGKKLAASLDEQAKIEAWLRRYPQYELQFNLAKAQPNPAQVTQGIAVPAEVSQ